MIIAGSLKKTINYILWFINCLFIPEPIKSGGRPVHGYSGMESRPMGIDRNWYFFWPWICRWWTVKLGSDMPSCSLACQSKAFNLR